MLKPPDGGWFPAWLLRVDSALGSLQVLAVHLRPQLSESGGIVSGVLTTPPVRRREMTKYLDPERTLSLGVLAVPDAVHAAAPEAHADGWREGVLVVPYSLALPFVLVLYRLTVRFGAVPEAEELRTGLLRLADGLRRMDEEVEGRLSRALVQLANARDGLRGELAGARGVAERLASDAQSELADGEARFDPSSGRG